MAGNLTQFASLIRSRGIAKASKYKVKISIPRVLQDTEFATQVGDIEMLAESTQFPEFSLVTQRIVDDGIGRETVYDKTCPPIMMSFICTSDMTTKSFFDFWVQRSVRSMGGIYEYPINYMSESIQIVQCDESGKERYVVTLIDAYPKLVADIPLQAGSRDYNRVQVQFVYRWWYSEARTGNEQIGYQPPGAGIPGFPDAAELGNRNSVTNSGALRGGAEGDNAEEIIKSFEESGKLDKFKSMDGGDFSGGGASGSW